MIQPSREGKGAFFIERYAVYGGWLYCSIEKLTSRGGAAMCFVPDQTVEIAEDSVSDDPFAEEADQLS